MENSDCGIAASADPAARAGKIRYDIEMNWKFQFFSHGTSSWQGNRILILRIAPRTFNFLLPDRKFGKTGTGARVIRCGLLPWAPLNKPLQAHSNP
ncbi:MAG: hypothetical protein Q8L53_06685 [Aestuariivirga sp.]|nr:hypothetical protein [Aestuariivirga sp.]